MVMTLRNKDISIMAVYRSRTSTHGRNMAGARGLWRATGMTDADFGKPIIAIANSFTQFVPGHVHSRLDRNYRLIKDRRSRREGRSHEADRGWHHRHRLVRRHPRRDLRPGSR